MRTTKTFFWNFPPAIQWKIFLLLYPFIGKRGTMRSGEKLETTSYTCGDL
jgi:hypothetical protein